MKGAQHWACTGLTELGLDINKQNLKETGWQKIRDGRGLSRAVWEIQKTEGITDDQDSPHSKTEGGVWAEE